jgi:phage portal protein BeeE
MVGVLRWSWFAGEMLQLRIRREIMRFIDSGAKTREEIALAFGLEEYNF